MKSESVESAKKPDYRRQRARDGFEADFRTVCPIEHTHTHNIDVEFVFFCSDEIFLCTARLMFHRVDVTENH